MGNKAIYGAFLLLLLVCYYFFVSSLPIPTGQKNILYIPSLIFIMLFLFVAMGKQKEEGEKEAVDGYFNF